MELKIHLGCLADSIKQQIVSQNLSISNEKAKELQDCADAINLLYLNDLMNDKEKTSIQKKLFTQIKKSVKIKKKIK